MKSLVLVSGGTGSNYLLPDSLNSFTKQRKSKTEQTKEESVHVKV